MAKGQSLQDPYLNALRRERIPVSIYLVNGIKARPRGHMELQDSRAQKPQIKIPASVPRDIVQIVLVRQRQAFT